MRAAAVLRRARHTVVADGAGAGLPQAQSRRLAGGLAGGLVAFAGYSFVWVPHYSADAVAARERTGVRRAKAAQGAAAPADGEDAAAAAAAAAATAAAVEQAKARPFSAGLATDNAPGSMWRSISAARELREAAGDAAARPR